MHLESFIGYSLWLIWMEWSQDDGRGIDWGTEGKNEGWKDGGRGSRNEGMRVKGWGNERMIVSCIRYINAPVSATGGKSRGPRGLGLWGREPSLHAVWLDQAPSGSCENWDEVESNGWGVPKYLLCGNGFKVVVVFVPEPSYKTLF